MPRFALWYHAAHLTPAYESGPWRTAADTLDEAVGKMHFWFRYCQGPDYQPVTITRHTESADVPTTPPAAKPYDAAAHLRSLGWVEPKG